MLFYDVAKIVLAGLEEAVAAFRYVQVLIAAVTMMAQHETCIAPGRAVADAHALHDNDRIVGVQFGDPPRER